MNVQYNAGIINGTNISLQVTVGTSGTAHTMVYLGESLIQEANTQSGNIALFVIGPSDKLKGQLLTIDTWITFTDQIQATAAQNDMALHYFVSGGFDGQQAYIADADDITHSSSSYNSFIEKLISFV